MLSNRLKVLIVVISVFTIVIGLIYNPFAGEKPKVVVVLKGSSEQYWQIVKAGAEKGFLDFGIEGKVIAPRDETEVDLQINLLKAVLNDQPDLLIVSPISAEIIPILDEFNENDIPVLLLDTDYPWENKIAYIGTNNFELGKMGGTFLATQLHPSNEVALIAGDLNHPISGERIKGAKAGLEAAGIKIATEKINLPNEAEPVKEVMETILQDHPYIKGVYAITDIMALGAFEAIEEASLNMPVIGADGVIEMIKLIENGILPGTVAQNPYDMGYLSVETAIKVLQGEVVESTIDSGVDIIIKGNALQRLSFQKELMK
ncbi:hypothetical protein BKP37_15545 [Anaerobacillus alkalilacustris]|uniref:Periplasmic binding protein domain-containing protein n=1 Tax=Anaerobacillus alkalilacustris TaxID=393763 RepID=A0A1S2LIN6_9BACI|nr:sugar ABC transporter substrate-binding protein [Anaerobacillus alkalilacustris]OIJ11547.1 hypothetical protein BKP37_15545 [Anaerobacillus alkalilacustris]